MVNVTGTAFSPDGTRFAAIARDTGFRVAGAPESVPGPKKGGDGPPADAKGERPKPPPPKGEAQGPFAPVLYVWDTATGQVLATRPAGGSQLEGVALGRDGAVVCGGSRHGAAYAVGRAERPDARADLGGHPGEVVCGAFDPANELVWSGGEGKVILAHAPFGTDPEPRFELRGCDRTVLRLAVSPDGRELAAVTGDLFSEGGTLHRFDLAARRADGWQSAAPRDRPNFVASLAPDGSRFAAVDLFLSKPNATRVDVRDLDTGRERVTDSDTGDRFLTLLPGGRMVCTSVLGGAKGLRLLGPDGAVAHNLEVPAGAINVGAPSVFGGTPDGRTVLSALPSALPSARAGFQVVAWEGTDPKPRAVAAVDGAQLPGPAPGSKGLVGVFPTALATDPQGRYVAVAVTAIWLDEKRGRIESRGGAFVFELATGRPVLSQVTPEGLRAAAFDPAGRLTAAGGTATAGVVYAWDVGTGAEVYALRGHTRPILSLAFGPDGRLATGGTDRTVKVWDPAARRELLTFDGFRREVPHVAFTPRGDLVCATGVDLLMLTTLGGVGTPTDWPPAEVRVFRTGRQP